jgi:hypothetical protein
MLQAREDAIVQAVNRLLAEKGFDLMTVDEVAVVNRIYDGAKNSKGESLFAGGMSRGSEYEWTPPFVGPTLADGTKTNGSILNRSSMIYQFTQYLTFFDDPGPSYDPMTFDWDRDPEPVAKSTRTVDIPPATATIGPQLRPGE